MRLFGDPEANRAAAARARAYAAARRSEREHFAHVLGEHLCALRACLQADDAAGVAQRLAQLEGLAARATEGHPTQRLCRRLADEAAADLNTPRTTWLLQLLAAEQLRLAGGLPGCPDAVLQELARPGP